jgi:hypothetical protein
MLRAVVPLVPGEWFAGLGRRIIDELIAFAFRHAVGALQLLATASRRIPCFAAVVGALDDLAKPATRLRCVDSIGINRRPFHMIDFPAREMWAADLPSSACPIRCEDERAFLGANQNSNFAHISISITKHMNDMNGRKTCNPRVISRVYATIIDAPTD